MTITVSRCTTLRVQDVSLHFCLFSVLYPRDRQNILARSKVDALKDKCQYVLLQHCPSGTLKAVENLEITNLVLNTYPEQ